MLDVSAYKVLVLVFGQEGCPACEAYIPQLQARVEALRAEGERLWLYEPGAAPPLDVALVLVYDVAAGDKAIQQLADRYNVSSLPTTVVQLREGGTLRLDGVIATGHIDQVLRTAASHA